MATLVAVTQIASMNATVELGSIDIRSVPNTKEGIAQLHTFLDNSAARVKEAVNTAKARKMLSDIHEGLIKDEAALRAQITTRLNTIAQQRAELAASAKAVLDKAKEVEEKAKTDIKTLVSKVQADQKEAVDALVAQAEANKQQITTAANSIPQVSKANVNQAKKQIQGLAKQFKL